MGFGIFDFCTHSRRLISKNWFPRPIWVAEAICGTRFDLRDSKRRALENCFCVRICYVFLISKLSGNWHLGLCTTSGLAFEKNVFRRRKNRILSLSCGSSKARTEAVHRPTSYSPLHFDIGNILANSLGKIISFRSAFESRVFIENWKWVSKGCGSYLIHPGKPLAFPSL